MMSYTKGGQKEIDVVELQVQLAEALQAQDKALQTRDEALRQLQATLPTPRQPESPNPSCAFLEKLPLEIRNQIYHFLLFNDVLSTSQVLELWGEDHKHIYHYDLSPAVLRTCRQINEEACKILYGSNIFVIYFPSGGSPQTPVIIRWKLINDAFAFNDVMARGSVLRMVQHWKVVLDINSTRYFEYGKHQSQHRYFRYFCEALCHNPPKSLQVLVQPNGNCPEDQPPSQSHPWHPPWKPRKPWSPEFCYDEMSEFLDPLSILRNVPRFQFVEVNGINFPLRYGGYVSGRRGSIVQSRQVPKHLTDQIKLIVEGDSPVQLLFEMSQRLLNYAQSFETHKNFRIDMDPDRPFVEHLEKTNPHKCTRFHACEPEGPLIYIIRPFVDHPVEHGLRVTYSALNSNNISEFKAWRNKVILALEAQFQWLSTASLSIAAIIKREKREGGAFDVGRRDVTTLISSLLQA